MLVDYHHLYCFRFFFFRIRDLSLREVGLQACPEVSEGHSSSLFAGSLFDPALTQL